MMTKNCTQILTAALKVSACALVMLSPAGLHGQVLVPTSGSNTVACGTNTLLQDDGGSGNYSNNANGYTVLDAGFNAQVQLAGTYTIESGWDYMYIYAGVGTGGQLLGTYTGNGNINITGNPGQALTVHFDSDGSVQYAGFDLNVSYTGPCIAVPCTGTPGVTGAVPPPMAICPGESTNVGLNTTYTLAGIVYQWQSSTTSSVGPYTPVPTGTNNALNTPTLSASTWYQAVITCTNTSGSTVSAPAQIIVQGTTTNTVPYYEGFESVGYADRLPNCSWLSTNLGTTFRTYTTSATQNRQPLTGSGFAAFSAPTTNNEVYTNGIYMVPGITYSAALNYATEYSGAVNWNKLELLVADNQNGTGQTPLASAQPAATGAYKLLDATFQVPQAGFYYIVMRATGVSGGASYLMIDDISVTIPCTPASGNVPNVAASAGASNVCLGQDVQLIATGADVYLWSNSSSGAQVTGVPGALGTNTFSVHGTNTLSGCSSTAAVIVQVQAPPFVSAFASPAAVCEGNAVMLVASGAGLFQWSHGPTGAQVTDTPGANTIYTVVGVAANNCTAMATVPVQVNPLPAVAASVNNSNICKGDAVVLSATGPGNFSWTSTNSPAVLQGAMVTVVPSVSDNYTVVGVDQNGCKGSDAVTVVVNICEGINDYAGLHARVYPNPATDALTVETAAGVTGIRITDLSGRVLSELNGNGQVSVIDVSGLSAGVYLVETHSGEKTEVIRFIKQ